MSSIPSADIVRCCSHIMTFFLRLIIYFNFDYFLSSRMLFFSYCSDIAIYIRNLYLFLNSVSIFISLSFSLTGSFLLLSFISPVFYFTSWTLCNYQYLYSCKSKRARKSTSGGLYDGSEANLRSLVSLFSSLPLPLYPFLSLYFSFFLTLAYSVSQEVIVVIFRSDDQLARDPITFTLTHTCLS